MNKLSRYLGCFLGLLVGDAYGAAFEGGMGERLLWRYIGKTSEGLRRYTDDTQMSIDVADSFLKNGHINQDHLAETFSSSYRWSRGYGTGAAKLLKKIRTGSNWKEVNKSTFKQGSLGNGAAMRAPVVALCFPNSLTELQQGVIKVSEITHAHPLAIEGAQLIAYVVSSFLNGYSLEKTLEKLQDQCHSEIYQNKLAFCLEALRSEQTLDKSQIKSELGNSIEAAESCITAIYFAAFYAKQSVDQMLNQIFALGGDADTIAAMATSIWGAANGYSALATKANMVENSELVTQLATKLYYVQHTNSNLSSAI